jgi:hypothetical protein
MISTHLRGFLMIVADDTFACRNNYFKEFAAAANKAAWPKDIYKVPRHN